MPGTNSTGANDKLTPTEEDLAKLNAGAKQSAEMLQRVLGKPKMRPSTPLDAHRKAGHKVVSGRNPDGSLIYSALEKDEPIIKAHSPKSFTMMLDDHSPVTIDKGIVELAKHIFDHWYCVAQGVKAYDPKDMPVLSTGETEEELRERIRKEERERILAEMAAQPKPADKPVEGNGNGGKVGGGKLRGKASATDADANQDGKGDQS